MTSAQGIDVSHYQPVLTAASLAGLDFAFCKATDGSDDTDDHFAANWAVIKTARKFAGAYHELRPGFKDGIADQAAHFLSVVRAQGLEPGDMLAVSASDYRVTDADVKAFCDWVADATGGLNPVIVYTDLSVAVTLTSCAGYPLWLAWPSGTATANVAPWESWHLWQWNETGQDKDAFNGDADAMAAWIATYVPAPAPPITYVEADVKLAELKQGDAGQACRNWQGLLVAHGYGYLIAPDPGSSVEDKSGADGIFGPKTAAATATFRQAKKLPAGEQVDAAAWEAALTG
jgi:lysozyme